ncbi:MAG: DUF4199 domain-containing protein [Flavobacterium sp.]|nr:DUF4199 domain-containing protein [Flavobacterium sp.]MBP8157270.1 DUF4199 domain-containing protein [Flavobacterium sp.]
MKNYSIEIKWTLRFILLVLAWAIGEKFIGLHDQHIDQYIIYTNLFALPAFLFFYLALREKKKYFFNHQMTWTQGFISGVILSFFIALLMPFAQLVIYKSITPHFFETAIEYKTTSPLLKYHMTLDAAKHYFNLRSFIIESIYTVLSMGTTAGAIVALIIRTKK